MAKLIAGVFAALAVVSAVPAVLLLNIDGVLLNAETYKRAFAEQKLYEHAPALLADQLTGNLDTSASGAGQTPELGLLTASDWQQFLGLLLPPTDLQSTTEAALDQLFSYVDGRSDSATISLRVLKQRIAGPAAEQAIRAVLASHPDCSPEQLAAMAVGLLTGGGRLELCNPPESVRSLLVSALLHAFELPVDRIPDEVQIIHPAPNSVPASGAAPFGSDPRRTIRLVRGAARLSLLMPLGLLLLAALLAARSLRGWLRWCGMPLFIAGLISLGIGLAAPAALNWVWRNFIAFRIPALVSPVISSAAGDLLGAVGRTFSQGILWDAGTIALAGLAAIMVSFFVGTRTPV